MKVVSINHRSPERNNGGTVKRILHALLTSLLALLTGGCISATVVQQSKEKTTDRFFPSAVYQSTNGENLALEGTLRLDNQKTPGVRETYETNSYLVIARTHLGVELFPTNGQPALKRIEKSLRDWEKYSTVADRLPEGYEKITNLPRHSTSIGINPHYPKRAVIALLPITVAADAATLPFQAIGILIFYITMKSSHAC
jgi:hypothetical protein